MIINTILITFLVLLATKELAGASQSESAQRLATFMNVPIVTLLVIFIIFVALSTIEVLP